MNRRRTVERRVVAAAAGCAAACLVWTPSVRAAGSETEDPVEVVVEAFEAGRIEEVWPLVDEWGLPARELAERLLASRPGDPVLLGQLAETEWDELGKAAIHLHLWGNGAVAEPDRALAALLRAGAQTTAVEVWHRYRANAGDSLPDWLPESLVAALWLEGYDDEARQLFAALPAVAEGSPPIRPRPGSRTQAEQDAWSHYYEADRLWGNTAAAARRRHLVREALQPSGEDPYELAVALLRVRDQGLYGRVLQDATWSRLAAAWAHQAGRGELERFFLIDARHARRYQPNERAIGRTLNWRTAVEGGLIPVGLYQLREALYREIESSLAQDLERILALPSTSAGFFEPRGGLGSDLQRFQRAYAPFSVGIERPAPSDDSVAGAAPRAADELPPTLPVDGGRVVDLARDGGRWWVLHQGSDEIAYSAWHRRGYWLSTSADGGHSWAPPVHTGIVANAPLEAIEGSLAVGSGKLRLLARKAAWSPGMVLVYRDPSDEAPVYELEARLSDLLADRDGDGWTDILERGLFTDPESDDSDGDGLLDPEDPLPTRDRETSDESEALDAALREMIEEGEPLRRLLLAGSEEFQAAQEAAWRGPLPPARLVVPELPFARLRMPMQLFLLPEELAEDDAVAGDQPLRIKLWITNRAADRAFLSWVGSDSGGGVEVVRGPMGWYAAAGWRAAGCMVTHVGPPSAELLGRLGGLLPSTDPTSTPN